MRFRLAPVAASLLAAACGGAPARPCTPADLSLQEEAEQLLAFYEPISVALYAESARASWLASTDVSDEHTGMRTGADTAPAAFTGNADA